MNEIATPLRITPSDLGSEPVSTSVAIDIRDLDFYYGKAHALKSVSFGVPSNAVTSIIGPSGCGKSTLLRTINRIFELYPEQRATVSCPTVSIRIAGAVSFICCRPCAQGCGRRH